MAAQPGGPAHACRGRLEKRAPLVRPRLARRQKALKRTPAHPLWPPASPFPPTYTITPPYPSQIAGAPIPPPGVISRAVAWQVTRAPPGPRAAASPQPAAPRRSPPWHASTARRSLCLRSRTPLITRLRSRAPGTAPPGTSPPLDLPPLCLPQGLSCVVTGLLGTSSGTTAYNENIDKRAHGSRGSPDHQP
jgi:hypothetical protein